MAYLLIITNLKIINEGSDVRPRPFVGPSRTLTLLLLIRVDVILLHRVTIGVVFAW
jgi:hypothetical protein